MEMKKLVYPKIEPKFKNQKMPVGFVNDVRGWSFNRLEVEEAAKKRRLLTLDINMAGKGVCSLGCEHCFLGKYEGIPLEELMIYLKDAKLLGLRSVKLIGPGEPLEDRGLLPFLRMLRAMDIIPLIFTKGHVIGDDELSAKKQGMDGRQLAEELKKLGVSILLGTTSFNPELEDAIVRRQGYHQARNEAIIRLIEAGFNDFMPGEPTRLSFVCAPVTPRNIGEAYELYVWARERHIQPVMAPTMIAGKALGNLCGLLPDGNGLVELYVRINLWAIEHGVTTLEELREQGIAAYAGAAPCNQVAVGMFLKGHTVLRCPGDDISVQGDLREKSLTEIWEGSENRRVYSGQYNNGCPPKEGKSFPERFFEKVMKLVEEHFGAAKQ